MKPVHIIGTGLSIDHITDRQRHLAAVADVLVGGARALDFFRESQAEKLPITADIAGLVAQIRQRMKRQAIVVLASGDPLFYGIGTTLLRELGPDNVEIHPNISSVAFAFAAIKLPWHDAVLVSLHGREPANLDSLIRNNDKLALLTDPSKSPAWVAAFLASRHLSGYRMCVLEKLGTPEQLITWFDDTQKALEQPFEAPNLVILVKSSNPILSSGGAAKPNQKQLPSQLMEPADSGIMPIKPYTGMPDHFFIHESGLITKPEIRSIVIARLRLTNPGLCLWDLGAGSGSVSIEAAPFLPRGSVYAVEKKHNRVAMIQQNLSRFNIRGVQVVEGTMPAALADLPDPDRVFIGGGGKDLVNLINICARRLSDSGIIVINTVLLQHLEPVLKALRKNGFAADLIQVQVSSARTMPFGERLEAGNPVMIFSGERIKE